MPITVSRACQSAGSSRPRGGRSNSQVTLRRDAELRGRIQRLLRTELSFVPNREFQQCEPPADVEALTSPAGRRVRLQDFPKGNLYPHIANLCETGLLSAAESRDLFRRLNYYKFLVNSYRVLLDPSRPDRLLVERAEKFLVAAAEIRDRLVQSNLRLVVYVAKNFVSPRISFDDALSEGIFSLLLAVERFDYSRGFQFSTYAYRVIQRNISRKFGARRGASLPIVSSSENSCREVADYRLPGLASERAYDFDMERLSRFLASLDRRERFIVRCRFALGRHRRPKSCQRLAGILGISKERVRQLERRALEKLKRMAEVDQEE